MTSPSVASPSPQSAEDVARAEMDRQRRLIDQTVSMQSSLRDLNRAFGTSLACIVLIASLIGVALAFADGGPVKVFGLSASRATWLGWLAVATFAITLVELVLDPRGAARRRAQAVHALAALKGEYRAAVPDGQAEAEARRLSERYEAVMGSIPEVPELLFNRLKSAHLRKIEISKILSGQPGASTRKARSILRKRFK